MSERCGGQYYHGPRARLKKHLNTGIGRLCQTKKKTFYYREQQQKLCDKAVDKVLSRDEMVTIIKSDKAKLSNFGRSPGGNKEGLNYYTYGKSPPLKTW